MAVSTIDPNGLNIGQIGGTRNKIINGAMVIDQRNAGAAVAATNEYTLDRWFGRENTDGAITVQQVSDAPAGFVKSAKVTVTTADASVGSSQFAYFAHRFEGLNISDFSFGTASASPITLSFWIKSSLTGTFGGAVTNGTNNNRAYPFTYTISSADTWEEKAITIAGDTSGTWATDSSQAMALFFGLGNGSSTTATAGAWTSTAGIQSATGAVDLISTLNATWQITGVQLEAGDTATPFEHRSYGQELALCQRYYIKFDGGGAGAKFGSGWAVSTSGTQFSFGVPVQMRSNPTLSYSLIDVWDSANIYAISSATSVGLYPGELTLQFNTSGLTTYRPCAIRQNATGGHVSFSAEL